MTRRISCLLVLVCLLAVLPVGCDSATSSEPPFDWGIPKSLDQPVRSTKLIDLSLENGRIVYQVEYPALGLSSEATLSFPTKEMTREVFPGKWVVIYKYDDTAMRFSHLPTSFEVYQWVKTGDHVGQLINTYWFVEIPRVNYALYRNSKGRQREISVGYFSILPAGP